MSDEVKWTKTISDVNDGILANLDKPHPSYYFAWLLSIVFVAIGIASWAYQVTYGMGAAGLNSPVYWGSVYLFGWNHMGSW